MHSMDSNDIFLVSEDKSIDEEVEKLFQYWRNRGFPNYYINDYDKDEELQKLIKFDDGQIFYDNKLKQTMHSLGFLWTYFPHWVDVKFDDSNSLMDNWNNDKKLRDLIRKTYIWQLKYGAGKFTINRLRQNAKVYCSKQSVSNFRPTVSKFIYNKFGNAGVVWDMCGGWGGRLFGFLSSNCKKYIGTEPSIKTFEGLTKLSKDFTYVKKDVELYCTGSEDFKPDLESLDLCFTSPPYFDTEKYSEESTQSFKKFPTKESWIEGFLQQTTKNCFQGLKRGGPLIINISNTPKYKNLESEMIRVATEEGFILEDTYNLILSSISGRGIKYEPVFIFRKQ